MAARTLVLLIAAAAAFPVAELSADPHQEAFERITRAVFPPRATAPLYRTIKTFVKAIDGVDLYTVAFVPLNIKQHFDTVMIRTPYGTDGLKSEGEMYVAAGFAAVMQDFRGRYRSTGTFQCWFNASVDALSTVNWIIEQPWSTRTVFQQGTSAPGLALYFSEVASPPASVVTALFPIVATAELHKTIYQGGAYRYSLIHGWLNGILEGSFEGNFTSHEGLTDYWENVTMTDKWERITAPAVHLTGWYDIFNQQQIDAYTAYQEQSTVGRGENFIIIMPTGHCAGGQIPWPGANVGYAFANNVSLILFLAHGTDPRRAEAQALLASLPPMYWYIMGPGLPGTIGNFWVNGSSFSDATGTNMYLTGGNALSLTAPTAEPTYNFLYNPRDPVPTLGGNNLLLPQCGPWDQTPVEHRTDVVTFTSARLSALVVINGKVQAQLYVSSNCTDTDFTVKVTDVFPNGSSLLVQDGIVRMRWRNGGATPSLLTPGTVYPVMVDVWTTSYVFNSGHAIRVDISSSNFPRFSANPNNGLPLTQAGPLIPASNTIYVGPAHPSRLILPVVPTETVVAAAPFLPIDSLFGW